MTGHGWVEVLVCGMAACLLGGCGEDTAAPERVDGAGLRIVLPSGTESWDGVTVDLIHDNVVPSPTCTANNSRFRNTVSVSVPEEDLCTRKMVEIWNLQGERVRFMPDIPFPREGWDRRDDQGELVPRGVYRTHEECLDSQGSLTFDGFYNVWDAEQAGSCEWIIWSTRLDPGTTGPVIEIESLPVRSGTKIDVDENGATQRYYPEFENPYRLRVSGPSGERFEQEIRLVDGEFTEIHADFMSLVTSSEE